jgi:hypothetical protein
VSDAAYTGKENTGKAADKISSELVRKQTRINIV